MNSELPTWPEDEPPHSQSRLWFSSVATIAALGAAFSAVSTSDFMQFLDRQVHAIHCSFVPGAGPELGESGCRTVMMSPYSSFFRESLWGGVPVSLWALAVFSFIFYRAGTLAVRGSATRAEATFLLLSTVLPLGMSAIYGTLAATAVGATCKVCVGMYVCSGAAFALAFLARTRTSYIEGSRSPGRFAAWFAQGVAFVVVLSAVYLAFRPGSEAEAKAEQGCGTLVRSDDPAGVMIELGRGAVPAIEVLDPLCPSCRAFDRRLAASSLGKRLALKAVLFPLDSSCNWMVTKDLHPGACAVSEAVLCSAGLGESKDPAAARAVLSWAFSHQDEVRTLGAKDPKALREYLETEFPQLKGCIGGHPVRNKLTKSLRWAVGNALPVLTPQLFVHDKRLCDEDTDLGLEYTLSRMLSTSHNAGATP